MVCKLEYCSEYAGGTQPTAARIAWSVCRRTPHNLICSSGIGFWVRRGAAVCHLPPCRTRRSVTDRLCRTRVVVKNTNATRFACLSFCATGPARHQDACRHTRYRQTAIHVPRVASRQSARMLQTKGGWLGGGGARVVLNCTQITHVFSLCKRRRVLCCAVRLFPYN